MRTWIETENEATISTEAVISYSYELLEWTKELCAADVWNVILNVTLTDGSEHSITDVHEMIKFLRDIRDENGAFSSRESKPGTLEYYVKNLWRYLEMQEKAEKLSG